MLYLKSTSSRGPGASIVASFTLNTKFFFFFSVHLLIWPLFSFIQSTLTRSSISATLQADTAAPHPLLVASIKVLSVGVGGDGDVDDEGGLVLDAAAPAVGERSHLHAVRARLPQRLRGEQHPLHVLVPQGEGQRRVLVHHQEGGPGVHHAVLRVGHQPDEVLVGGNAERQRQQLVLQGVGAQGALQVVGWTVLQAKPSEKAF